MNNPAFKVELFDEELGSWVLSAFSPTEGFASYEEANHIKERAEIINPEYEYRVDRIVNGKSDPIGLQLDMILNK